MRLTTGTIASLVLTIGALMLLIAGASSESASSRRLQKPSSLRSNSRKLYNYSRNSGSNYASYSGQYSGYAASNDDAAAAANDDYNDASYSSYSNSYYNGQANGNSYNGRDQQWGGQNVQWNYDDDDYEPEVVYETYDQDDKFLGLGKFAGLSAMETFAVVGLVILLTVSLLALVMLKHGFNVVHLCQVYCCRGVFGHKDQKTSGTEPETVEEGFVKLDDEA